MYTELWHGSVNIIEKPIYGHGNSFNDSGQGFYCTEDIELAKEWAATDITDGYANHYIFDMPDAKLLNLSDVQYTILNWLALLVDNRKFAVSSSVGKLGKDYLKENFPDLKERIIADDFLKLDLGQLFKGDFCVIGNYPYNISSQIFFKVLDYKEQIPCCSGMLQKEVAERLASGPGSKAYGILSVLLQAWYDVEYLFTVSETVFDPPPKVKSAVIRMIRNDRKELGCDEALFKTVVKTSFNQRRKQLRNSMKPILGKEFGNYDLPIFNKRPEQLSVEQFVELTRITQDFLDKNK